MSGMYVGIDIGGTKTHLRAMAGGRIAGDLVVPTATWRRHDWQHDAGELLQMSGTLANGGRIAAMAVGAHGCDDAEECAAFQASLAARASYPVRVLNDAELIPAAMGVTDGIGVVAGTGSIAVTRNPGDEMLVAGGWGWVIGDEGSASGLVREAARAAGLHLDLGGSAEETLVRRLCQTLGIASPVRLGSAIAACGSATRLGSHASAVFEAAAEGSALARRVIDEGAASLVDLVKRLVQRGARARHVVAGGGVICSQPPLSEAFLKHMKAQFGAGMTALILEGPPVAGACAIARNLLSTPSQLESQEQQ